MFVKSLIFVGNGDKENKTEDDVFRIDAVNRLKPNWGEFCFHNSPFFLLTFDGIFLILG